MPVLFGEVESVTESVVTSLYLKVQEASEESCTLDHVLQRFPTDARDVAAVCRKLSERARQVSVRETGERQVDSARLTAVCFSVRTRPSEESFTSLGKSR